MVNSNKPIKVKTVILQQIRNKPTFLFVGDLPEFVRHYADPDELEWGSRLIWEFFLILPFWRPRRPIRHRIRGIGAKQDGSRSENIIWKQLIRMWFVGSFLHIGTYLQLFEIGDSSFILMHVVMALATQNNSICVTSF